MKAKWVIYIGIVITLSLHAQFVNAEDNGMIKEKIEKHALFTGVLSEHISEKGLVNYSEICGDNRLNQYLINVSNTQWNQYSEEDQLAFWINSYNAFTLKAICDAYPVESINDLHKGGLIIGTVFKSTIWDKEFFTINGREMSLGYIEHEILRKGPEKARIHFAIVCAAISCPPLRQEAYEGYKIDQQLEDQGNKFLGRKDLNSFDLKTKTANLSGIFKWFKKDFGRNSKELLVYLSNYAPSEVIRESLRNNSKQWRIRWNKYNWSLNDINNVK